MKKQTISKIAAVALAAMSVVPMFGVTASADVVLDNGNANNGFFKQAYGIPNKAEWQLNTVTETVYELKQYEEDYLGNKIKLYKLEQKSQSTDNYTIKDTESTTFKSRNGNVTLAPYGLVYYAYANTLPAAYSKADGTGAKDKLDKAKNDAIADKKKVDDAIKAWNKEKKGYEQAVINAKKTPGSKGHSFTKMDGTVIYVYSGDGDDLSYYTDYGCTTHITGSYTPLADGDAVTLLNGEKFSDDSTTSIAKGAEYKDYSYVYTTEVSTSTLNVVQDFVNNAYIKVDATDGTTLIKGSDGEGGTTRDFKIQTAGSVVPSQNPDGSSSSGLVNGGNSGTSTTTPSDSTTKPTAKWSYYYSTYYYLYSPGMGRYYPSYYDAELDGARDARPYTPTTTTNTIDYRTSVSAEYPYVSSVPNRYYKTAADAVQDAKDHGYTNPTAVNYYNSYYYNQYGYLYGYNYSTTSTKDTSTVTIGKYTGWTYVKKYINSAKSGSSYTVKMNTETEIPSTVLKALYGKNVTVNFKFNSGASISIKGTDMSSTSAINTNIRYVKNVPSAIAKKAVKSNSGVSSAQFSVSGGSLGASASVTVKFDAKRSGCTATLYRYNASANSLSKISTSTVKSNGYCTLGNVAQGGDYVIVLS